MDQYLKGGAVAKQGEMIAVKTKESKFLPLVWDDPAKTLGEACLVQYISQSSLGEFRATYMQGALI